MRQVLIMLAIIGSALVIAADINKHTENPVMFTSGPPVSMDDVVDAVTGRIPKVCVTAADQAVAQLPRHIRRDDYVVANTRHFAEHECIAGITGATPS